MLFHIKVLAIIFFVMLTFFTVSCKRLVTQRSIKLVCKNIPLMTTSRWQCQLVIPKTLKKSERSSECSDRNCNKVLEAILLTKLINQNRNSNGILWSEVLKKLKDLKVADGHSEILKILLSLQNVDDGLSYYNYLTSKGKKFTALDFLHFLKLISSRKDAIQNNETLIKYIYNNVKNYLLSVEVVQSYVIDVIAEVPDCFYDFVKSINEKKSAVGNSLLAIKALERNEPEIASSIIKYCSVLHSDFTDAYMNYFIRMAKNGQFTPTLVTQLVETFNNVFMVLECNDLFSYFNTIVEIANQHQKDYIWSVHQCVVNNSVCSKCCSTLNEKCISEEEFNYIKKDFLSQIGLFNKSVFLSSSDSEIKKFMKFLDTCQPYDIVVDSLNVIYVTGYDQYKNISQIIKILVDEGFRVLVIGKKHSSKRISSALFLRKEEYKSRVQFFFLSNLSDDDIFILHAALHGGLKTYFLSNDLLSCYDSRLSVAQRDLFIKWKIYHQYCHKFNKLIPPRRHLGLSQLTSTPNENGEKFIWHMSWVQSSGKLSCITPLKWICLEAKRKNQRSL